MSLKDQITEDMKAAMRARDTGRLGTIRLLLAAIKQREVDERITLDDAAVTAVVEKLIKQRRDSIAQYTDAGRTDLAEIEQAEMAVLEGYMPVQLDDTAIDAEVAGAIAALSAAGPQDMGKVMGRLKPALAGRADMTKVSARVKAALAS
ncbi:GatB/YqeY domain-containing protein [Robbsia andropogonis]|uniref:GatB/YqeY domain-containing protein n=1 Tax=Robbsia andropogonis TaxID=28092 RepID=UPI002A6B8A54|nr:GatB/YqeY domain-containing protein [Robbsia andropogonis]